MNIQGRRALPEDRKSDKFDATRIIAEDKQLEGCGHVAKKEFSVAETQNIIKYLNERFYHYQ